MDQNIDLQTESERHPLSLETVIERIRQERQYQKRAWGVRTPMAYGYAMVEKTRGLADYLIFIQHYLSEAITAITTQPNEDAALDNIRKITALAVAYFDQTMDCDCDLKTMILAEDPSFTSCSSISVTAALNDIALNTAHAMANISETQKSLVYLRGVVRGGILCLQTFGCPIRDLSNVINKRDNQPA